MADFFKGLAGGFGTGLQFSQAMRERQERERLREAMSLSPQEMQQRQATPEEFGRAQAETQALAAQDAQEFGLTPQDQPAGISYAPQMPVEGQRIGPTQYGLGGQTFNRMPTQQEIESARFGAAANVIAERDPLAAMRMRQDQTRAERDAQLAPLQLEQLRGSISGQAQQRALTGIQLSDAERKQQQQAAFDTGFTELNQQKFEKPEDRTAAILSLVERTQGVAAAEQLRATYSQNELNQISLQSKKFDEGFRQSRAKGVIPALEWFDEQNTSFKLERDPKNPFRVIQVNTDGTRSVFADAKNERELGMIVDAKAKPGGFLELAKFDLDQKKADDLAKYYRDVAGSRGATGLKQKVADFKEVYGRDPTEAEKGVLADLTNKPREFTTADVNARAKLLIEGGMMDPDDPTKPISPQKALQIAQAELSGTPYVSPVDKLIADMDKARKDKNNTQPAPSAAPAAVKTPAPRQTGSIGVDTSRPRTDINPVTNLPREAPVQAPNLVEAASRGLDAGQARYVTYLQAKIAAGQKLTRDETAQAKRFGLQ